MANKTAVVGLGLLVLWALTRKRQTTGTSGGLRLQLLDESGNVVGEQARMGALTWNPFGSTGAGLSTQEGKSYTLRAIVTNLSTKDGLPVNVTFQVSHNVSTGGVNRLSLIQEVTFAVGGPVGTFLPANADGTFAIPVGEAGKTGEAVVVVRTLEGVEVARATDTFTIGSSAISYSATVSLTPIQTTVDYLAQIAATTSRDTLIAIYAAASAAAGRGEISTTEIVVIYEAFVAQMVVYYKNLIAKTTTHAENNNVRYGGSWQGITLVGFEPDRSTNKLNYAAYLTIYDYWVTRPGLVTLSNQAQLAAPARRFADILVGRRR